MQFAANVSQLVQAGGSWTYRREAAIRPNKRLFHLIGKALIASSYSPATSANARSR